MLVPQGLSQKERGCYAGMSCPKVSASVRTKRNPRGHGYPSTWFEGFALQCEMAGREWALQWDVPAPQEVLRPIYQSAEPTLTTPPCALTIVKAPG